MRTPDTPDLLNALRQLMAAASDAAFTLRLASQNPHHAPVDRSTYKDNAQALVDAMNVANEVMTDATVEPGNAEQIVSESDKESENATMYSQKTLIIAMSTEKFKSLSSIADTLRQNDLSLYVVQEETDTHWTSAYIIIDVHGDDVSGQINDALNLDVSSTHEYDYIKLIVTDLNTGDELDVD